MTQGANSFAVAMSDTPVVWIVCLTRRCFLLAIKGEKGERGDRGLPGIPGKS